MTTPDVPTLAELHKAAVERWGPRSPREGHSVCVRLTYNGKEYMALALRTTATGSGVEEVCSSTANATEDDARQGLADAIKAART